MKLRTIINENASELIKLLIKQKLENSKKDLIFEQLKYGLGVCFVGFVGVIIKIIVDK